MGLTMRDAWQLRSDRALGDRMTGFQTQRTVPGVHSLMTIPSKVMFYIYLSQHIVLVHRVIYGLANETVSKRITKRAKR